MSHPSPLGRYLPEVADPLEEREVPLELLLRVQQVVRGDGVAGEADAPVEAVEGGEAQGEDDEAHVVHQDLAAAGGGDVAPPQGRGDPPLDARRLATVVPAAVGSGTGLVVGVEVEQLVGVVLVTAGVLLPAAARSVRRAGGVRPGLPRREEKIFSLEKNEQKERSLQFLIKVSSHVPTLKITEGLRSQRR